MFYYNRVVVGTILPTPQLRQVSKIVWLSDSTSLVPPVLSNELAVPLMVPVKNVWQCYWKNIKIFRSFGGHDSLHSESKIGRKKPSGPSETAQIFVARHWNQLRTPALHGWTCENLSNNESDVTEHVLEHPEYSFDFDNSGIPEMLISIMICWFWRRYGSNNDTAG